MSTHQNRLAVCSLVISLKFFGLVHPIYVVVHPSVALVHPSATLGHPRDALVHPSDALAHPSAISIVTYKTRTHPFERTWQK
jgi:hypothetical protein